MRRIIAILEDNPQRTQAMKRVLKENCSNYEHQFFDNAPQMIEWLPDHLESVALLSLDHDLGANRDVRGSVFDPGTGREVAEFLATCACFCPLLIHSNNYPAVLGMCRVLEDAHWKFKCVVPHGDLEWIATAWAKAVANALV